MNLFAGFNSCLVGLRLMLGDKKLRRLAILPLLCNFLIFLIVVYFICFVYLPTIVAGLTNSLGTGFWVSALLVGAQVITFVIGLILSGFVSFVVGSLLASPFNSLLAECSLVHFGIKKSESFNWNSWFHLTLRMAGAGFVRALILMCLGLVLFFLSFIPIFHLPVLLIGLYVVSTDSLDYTLEAMQLGLRDRFIFYRRNFGRISGFTMGIGLVFLVPGMSFVMMPATIIGASHLLSESLKLNPKGVSK